MPTDVCAHENFIWDKKYREKKLQSYEIFKALFVRGYRGKISAS